MIHALADVKSTKIGEGTNIWQFCVILENATIGRNCNINCNVFIENDVEIGNNVTIKPGVQIWDGLRIKNNVFVGSNVTFTNDKFPRSKQYPDQFLKTIIEEGASIGGGSVILCGITIGKNAMVGAGSIVTKDIPENELWFGNPAQFIRKIE
jgi:UDP-2-acetamido-3-amino-2,3-dideoxy-glucuronate N-acetyltransferase